ncbi:uncharacterized protein LOC106637789 [Copidosoma floridanum]|uniref:uncharacterized protein LOC106637789 n=1 Tax=Copidosoma floridanum TaxID=29053 RepID=UPI0006C9A8BA|nr:uncharacterized protein LOC106637789 [Copidosoma floridanum]XP_014206204.1 uncharacterized protein LOC106637789 [Copidosoma floridanum]XP_014206205.1 uncharacterized protein LOC106637789 [Copidosoma floridanum]XP_014206206.1 uncharacterized protein LOC106637789 [Copidosoma floridanum]
MSSSLETLSDSELRTKLIEHGYKVGPVTHTTRKILLKKLKMLMDDKTGARFSMASAKYSSDDTDDDTLSAAKKKKKTPVSTRRQTMVTTMPPPATTASPSRSQTKKRLTRNLNAADYEISDNEGPSLPVRSLSKEKTPEIVNKSPIKQKLRDDFDIDLDSDNLDDESKKTPIIVPKFGGGTTKVYNDTSNFTAADVNSPKSYESNWRIGRTYETSNYHTNTPTSTLTKDERYTVNLPKPSISANSSRDDSLLSKETTKKDDILANYDSPYLSEFTRRLSSTSATLSKPSIKVGPKYRLSSISGTPEVKETDTNGHYTTYTSPRTYPSSSSMTYVTSSIDKTQRDGNKAYKSASLLQREEVKNSQNMISMILLAVVVLFFGIISIAYLGLEAKTEFPLSTGT